MDSEEDFENVYNNQFSTFRLSIYNPNSSQQTSSSTPTKLRNSHNKKGHTDAVAHFKKNIKRDKTQYGILKEDKQWDSWNRSTKATARTHDCEDVFNETYIPNSNEEKQLFFS